MPIEDISLTNLARARCLDGGIVSQFVGEAFDSQLTLQFVTRAKMFSRGVDYGTTPVYPYEKNVGLECWWREAMQGTQFRVYADAYVAQARAAAFESALIGAGSPTKTWNDIVLDTDPQRMAGGLVYVWDVMTGASNRSECKQGFHVASNAAATVTFSNDLPAVTWNNTQDGYYFDHRYQTYVIGMGFNRFAPMELTGLDRFNIVVPLARYVA